jgi:Arabinose efflux permease
MLTLYLVLFARGVYSLMWFYMAPILPTILREYGVEPIQAGLLPAVFIVGAAATQLPAGYLGARYGHDRVAGVGMAVFGASSILLSVAPTWESVLVFRALGGVGAGLFFSTAGATLIALRTNAVGSALGWYNASFNIGAFVGYYWGYVASVVGWRLALMAPGVLGVALGVLLLMGQGIKTKASFSLHTVVFGLASFPFWGAVYAANSLAATWIHLYRQVSEEAAGAISSAAMLSGFFGGIMGSVYDRARNKSYIFLGAPLSAALAYASLPFAPLELVALFIFLYGISFSAYITAVYAAASKMSENPAAALAVINVTNMALGLHFSYVFSWLMALGSVYPWLLLSALALSSAVSTYIAINKIKIY